MSEIQLTSNIDGIEINKVKNAKGIEGFGSIFQMVLNTISFIYLVRDKYNINLCNILEACELRPNMHLQRNQITHRYLINESNRYS